MRRIFLSVVSTFLLIATSLTSAHAQATQPRTWVSNTLDADDTNPCSRTAPCRTFAQAQTRTIDGGEINVLDPGAFSAVTINKSLTIISDGTVAGVLGSATNAITIDAAANAQVTLRGLTIDGVGTGLNGIRILSAGNVHIINCLIRGFQDVGSGNGIFVAPTAANVKVVVRNSYVSNNRFGILVQPTGSGQALVTVDDSVIASNTSRGIRAIGATAAAHLNRSIVTGNNIGIQLNSGGTLVSSGNNLIANNNTNGAPSSTLPLQ